MGHFFYPIPWDPHQTSNTKYITWYACLTSRHYRVMAKVPNPNYEANESRVTLFQFRLKKGPTALFSEPRITTPWHWSPASNTYRVFSFRVFGLYDVNISYDATMGQPSSSPSHVMEQIPWPGIRFLLTSLCLIHKHKLIFEWMDRGDRNNKRQFLSRAMWSLSSKVCFASSKTACKHFYDELAMSESRMKMRSHLWF